MRSRPASASDCAFAARSDAFVVSVSSTPSAGQLRDQVLEVAADERLAAGDADLARPDLQRTTRATRVISSKLSSSRRSRKRWSRPKTSFGMQ